MMKRIIFILSVITASLLTAGAAPYDSLIIRGNQAYNEGQYDEAIAAYEAVIESGYEAAELYYNLGNAWFKLDNMPGSILYYEKARRMAPENEDISYNLSLANSRIIDKIESVPMFFLNRWWHDLTDLLPLDKWAVFGLVSFMVALLTALVFFISPSVLIRKLTFLSGTLILVVTLVSFIITIEKYNQYQRHDEAIIFTPTVTVKSSPNESSIDLFVIHEGAKVKITDRVEGWSEIRIADGSVGWVRSSIYRKI